VGVVKKVGLVLATLATLAVSVAPAAAKPGDIIIGTDGDGSVLRLSADGSTQSEIASGPPVATPGGLDFARNGTLYFADYDLPGVVSVDPRSGDASVLSDDLAFFDEPLDLDVGPDGQIYVAEDFAQSILRVNPKTGAVATLADNLNFPYSVAVLPNRQIYFVDGTEVLNVDPRTLDVSPVVDIPTASLVGIEQTPRRTFYVTDDSNATIYEVNPRTRTFDEVASGDLLVGFYNPGLETRGTIIIGDTSTNRIVRVNPRTGDQSYVGGPLGGVSPEGIAIEPPKCKGKMATIVGSTKRDKLKGSKFGDVIVGLKGNDKIKGGKGRDLICGGKGKDRLKGQAGRDKLKGGPGKDKEIQ
jgi:streptogramin lyase